jgi:hypothetical protein
MSTPEFSAQLSGLQAVDPSSLTAWCEGSRLVDASGVPITLFHGTHEVWTKMLNFEERLSFFDVNTRGLPKDLVKAEREFLIRTGGAVWFTDDEWVAQGYSDQLDRPKAKGVISAHAKMVNPLDLRSECEDVDRAQAILSQAYGRDVNVHLGYGYGKGIAHAIIGDSSILIEYARNNGYDGLIYPDTDVYGRSVHNSFVIFEPSQLRVIDCQVESASEVPGHRG